MPFQNLYFPIFNLLQGGSFKPLCREVNRRNGEMLPFANKEIADYLKKWGFQEQLTNNPLMTKEDIIAWRKKTGADEKAKVFAYTGGSTGQSLKIPLSKKKSGNKKSFTSILQRNPWL